MYRYYLVYRPASIGTFPKGAKNIKNFDYREFVEEINHKAWGYVEYENPLTEKQIRDYELAEPDKTDKETPLFK